MSWNPVDGATSYIAQTNGSNLGTLNYTGPATSTSLASPADGTYQFKVQACNTAGCSTFGFSTPLTFRHTPPSPSTITVPQTSSGTVGLTWAAATYANLSEVEQSSDAVTYTKVTAVNATSASRIISTSGVYYFRIRACNSGICGPYSPVGIVRVTLVPVSAPTISASPTQSTDGSYAVTWGTVKDGAWYITEQQFNSGAFTAVDNDRSGTLSISGKVNGNYGYRVKACNVSGCGPYSIIATVKVLLVPASPAHAKIVKTQLTPATIRFSAQWDTVDTATTYEVWDGTATVYTGSPNTYLIQAGASNTLTGSYSVRACNASGCSAYVPFPAP